MRGIFGGWIQQLLAALVMGYLMAAPILFGASVGYWVARPERFSFPLIGAIVGLVLIAGSIWLTRFLLRRKGVRRWAKGFLIGLQVFGVLGCVSFGFIMHDRVVSEQCTSYWLCITDPVKAFFREAGDD